MKTQKIIISEKGKHILSEKDGFVVLGCIFVSKIDENGNPCGGLIGDAKSAAAILSAGVKPTAYTVKELLEALQIDPYDLSRIAEEMKPKVRAFV